MSCSRATGLGLDRAEQGITTGIRLKGVSSVSRRPNGLERRCPICHRGLKGGIAEQGFISFTTVGLPQAKEDLLGGGCGDSS